MTETKRLLDNGKVEVTTVIERDRYEGKAYYSQSMVDSVVEDFKCNCKIWIGKNREGFECLETKENWEPGEGDVGVMEDLMHFQLYLDLTYGAGRYEAFALGAYIHGSVSFSFCKGDDNRDRWDSGVVGFIGIPKDSKDAFLANNLTAAWNGEIVEYEVFDTLEEDWVDQCDDLDWEYCKKWQDEMAQKYGIDWDSVKVEY